MIGTALIPSDPALSPRRYEAARRALAECEQVDECWDWNSKAAALAEYGRQAKDDSLVIMAQRIQARAIRRAGELLKDIPAGHWSSDRITRTQVARAAGMSRMQQRQAAQIAQIPARKFEQLVEKPEPPRPYQLAAIGVKKRTYPPGRPKGGALGILQRRLEKAEDVVRELEAQLAVAQEVVNKLRAQIAALQRKA